MNGADIYMLALVVVCAIGIIVRSLLMEEPKDKKEVKNKEQ